MDVFCAKLAPSVPAGSVAASAGGPAPFSVSVNSPEHESSRIKKLEKLIKKRL